MNDQGRTQHVRRILGLFLLLGGLLPAPAQSPAPDLAAIRRQFAAKDAEILRLRMQAAEQDLLLARLLGARAVKTEIETHPQTYAPLLHATFPDVKFPGSDGLPPPNFDGAMGGVIGGLGPGPSSRVRTYRFRNGVMVPSTGVGDYSRPVGSPDDPVLSTGWTSGHGSRTQHVRDYYRHTRSGGIVHVHSYYRRPR